MSAIVSKHEPRNGLRALIDELYARRGGGGGGKSGTQYAFVYRPGGVAGENVYTDVPSLYAALSSIQGNKLVLIDDSIVSPAPWPAMGGGGTYNLDGVSFTSIASFTNANGGAILSLAPGVKWSFGMLTIEPWLKIMAAPQAGTSVVTVSANQECNLVVRYFSSIVSTTAQAFFEVKNGGFLWIDMNNADLGDGVNPVIAVDAGGAGQANLQQAALSAGSVAGAGASAFEVFFDTESSVYWDLPIAFRIDDLPELSAVSIDTDNTGSVDASGALEKLISLTAGTGIEGVIPAGIYLIKNPIALQNFLTMRASPGATFVLQMTPSGGLLTACAFIKLTTATANVGTVHTTPTLPSTTLDVSLPSDPTGSPAFNVQHGVTASVQTYLIENVQALGGGVYRITLDRPMVWAFVATDPVTVLSDYPHDIHLDFRKALFTGTGDRFVEMAGGFRCTVLCASADASSGSISDVGFGQDLGGTECDSEGFSCTLGANLAVGTTIESRERCTVSKSRVSGGAAGSAGHACNSNYDAGWTECWAFEIDTGFLVENSNNGFDNIDCYARACGVVGGVNGISIANSQGFCLDTFTGTGQSTATVSLAASSTDTRISKLASRSAARALSIFTGAKGTKASEVVCTGPTTEGITAADELTLEGFRGTSATAVTMLHATVGRHYYSELEISYSAGNAAVALDLAGSYHEIDGANIDMTGTSSSICIVCEAGVTVLRGVKGLGANVGLQVLAGATVVLGRDCDFSGCTNPIQLLNGGVILAEQSGFLQVPVTNANVTLDSKQQLNRVLEATGALTADVVIYIPQMVNNSIAGLEYDLSNATSGAHTVTFAGLGGGGGVTVAQGKRASGYMDGASNLQRDSPDT